MARIAFSGGHMLVVQGERDDVLERLRPGEWVLMTSVRHDVWVNPATVAYVVGDDAVEEAREAEAASVEELVARMATALGSEVPERAKPE